MIQYRCVGETIFYMEVGPGSEFLGVMGAFPRSAFSRLRKGSAHMTMPNERTRSLRWAFEVLDEIRDEVLVKDNHRAQAAELLKTFPAPATVLTWIHSDVSCIPMEEALAIEAAGDLLRVILRSESCPAKLRRSVMFALRHFPDSGLAKGWAKSSAAWTIRTWLLPEDVYG